MDHITKIDLAVNLFIQENLRTDWLTTFMKTFTVLNNGGLLVIGVVLLLLALKPYRYIGLVMSLSLVMEFILNNLFLKKLIARPRPYEIFREVDLLVMRARDSSFPSGHTGSAFAISLVFYLLLPEKFKGYGWLAILLSVLMGYSRLYVGIHYPTDVLGGALLGCLTSIFAVRLLKNTPFFLTLGKKEN